MRRLSAWWYHWRMRRVYRRLFSDPDLMVWRDGRYTRIHEASD